ncbi:MAG: hypothetical protein LBR37_00705 [Erysipelotrichaceae bacterium]|jgi:hypothetical protein|nr:hypothetical protein [Erysipelotrichaceae bacterium]
MRTLLVSFFLGLITLSSCIDTPIDKNTLHEIKESYLEKFTDHVFLFSNHSRNGTSTFTTNDIELKTYLGTFNECIVLILYPKGEPWSPSVCYGYETRCATWMESIDGMFFGSNYSTGILCWKEDRLYTFNEAYKQNFLLHEDLKAISMQLYGKILL